jgi:hypothetical protein
MFILNSLQLMHWLYEYPLKLSDGWPNYFLSYSNLTEKWQMCDLSWQYPYMIGYTHNNNFVYKIHVHNVHVIGKYKLCKCILSRNIKLIVFPGCELGVFMDKNKRINNYSTISNFDINYL